MYHVTFKTAPACSAYRSVAILDRFGHSLCQVRVAMLAIEGGLRNLKASMQSEDEMLTGKVVSQTAGEPLRCLCQLHQGTMQGHAIS
jgi:hypothetical protein